MWGLAYGENLLSKFVRRTKQWTPTVYRVGRTGESPHPLFFHLKEHNLQPFFAFWIELNGMGLAYGENLLRKFV